MRYHIETVVKKGLIKGYMPKQRFLFVFWKNLYAIPFLSYHVAKRCLEKDIAAGNLKLGTITY
jgi:hypothetical protein